MRSFNLFGKIFLSALVSTTIGFSASAKKKAAAAEPAQPSISLSATCDVQTSKDETSQSELTITADLTSAALEVLDIEVYEDFRNQTKANSFAKVSKTKYVAKFDSKYCSESEVQFRISFKHAGKDEKLQQVQTLQMGKL